MIRRSGIDIAGSIVRFRKDLIEKAEWALEYAVRAGVNHAKSTGYGTQPAAKEGEGSRSAHPGLWADVSGNLANSIDSEVQERGRGKFRGLVFSDREYADELEGRKRKAGGQYSVLGHLFEDSNNFNLEDEFIETYKRATRGLT